MQGVITGTVVNITSSSFMAASPSFTLAGDTEGGPPETYTWTRNGAPITNGGSFSISIGVNGVTDPSAYDNSRYRSTLTVTGRLPGVYQYSVSNRATSNTLTSSINIEGDKDKLELEHIRGGQLYCNLSMEAQGGICPCSILTWDSL